MIFKVARKAVRGLDKTGTWRWDLGPGSLSLLLKRHKSENTMSQIRLRFLRVTNIEIANRIRNSLIEGNEMGLGGIRGRCGR